jgi:ParB family transcriptional regulator, chromosome partitioning protein
LALEADKVRAEGWKWVIVEPEFNYEMTAGMRRVRPEPVALSEAEQQRLEVLGTRYNELCDHDDGDNSDEIAGQLQAIEAEMAPLEREVYRPEQIAIAGAFVSLDHDGQPRTERGYFRPEDWTEAKASHEVGEGDTARTDSNKTLSDKLVAELTAYRTAGLRNALAEHPARALTAVVHALAAATFYQWSDGLSCLQIMPRSAPRFTVSGSTNALP